MAVYEGSRYTNTDVYIRDGIETLDIRRRKEFSLEGATSHRYIEGDTIDNLAFNIYGDSHLKWVILEANKQYNSELDIKYGDIILIPSYSEVVNMYG